MWKEEWERRRAEKSELTQQKDKLSEEVAALKTSRKELIMIKKEMQKKEKELEAAKKKKQATFSHSRSVQFETGFRLSLRRWTARRQGITC